MALLAFTVISLGFAAFQLVGLWNNWKLISTPNLIAALVIHGFCAILAKSVKEDVEFYMGGWEHVQNFWTISLIAAAVLGVISQCGILFFQGVGVAASNWVELAMLPGIIYGFTEWTGFVLCLSSVNALKHT